jgi:hypothetical protein
VKAGSACHLLSRWFLVKIIFSTLKMEAICSSETSVDTQRTTLRYIPEDDKGMNGVKEGKKEVPDEFTKEMILC